jgi:protein tyrosine phosphatase
VQGYSIENKFIATQGPKKETVYDFWRMVDQYNVKIIIMLTNLIENNVIKCERYWPNSLNETEKYELYEVTYVEEQIFIDYIKRKFLLKNNFNNERKEVYQYFYPNWVIFLFFYKNI